MIIVWAALAVGLVVAACGDSSDQSAPQEQELVAVGVGSQDAGSEESGQAVDDPADRQGQDGVDDGSDQDGAGGGEDGSDGESTTDSQGSDPGSDGDDDGQSGGLRLTYLPKDATETPDGMTILRDWQAPETFGVDWGTSWNIRIIDVDELSIGAQRDAIPAINSPRFLTIEESRQTYDGSSPLVQVRVGDDVRGYPLDIMIWHEIVNDVIDGQPVAVTYCPLCNTAIAFDRRVDHWTFDFGVSGFLRNSDLVMFDRQTESLWQQSSGRALAG